MERLICFVVCLVFTGCVCVCNSSVKHAKKDVDEINVIQINDKVPINSLILGQKKVSTCYWSPIVYDSLIFIAKNYALKKGGNGIKIMSNKPTNNIFNKTKTSYKMKFLVLKTQSKVLKDTTNLVEDTNVYIYRFGGAPFYNFDLHIGDSIIKIKSYFKKKLKYSSSKPCVLWVEKGNNKSEKGEFKIEKGKKYYIKCYAEPRPFGFVPKIQIVDSIIGSKEFNFFEN